MTKKRLDVLLVERGLAESLAKAQALIIAGDVSAGGAVITSPSQMVEGDKAVAVAQPPPFVGRGGLKLEHALNQFRLDVNGLTAADIGASTGGFTDCLLQRGAKKVYAIDVGYGQLDYRLRQDARVVVMERVNARFPLTLPEKLDMAVIDVSFISVEKVIPAVRQSLKESGFLIVLVKPQFEARRAEVGKGGIIKQPMTHALVLGRFIKWAVGEGFRLGGLIASPIEGAAGNKEFLALLRVGGVE